MRALVQRVERAEVDSRSGATEPWETVGAIGPGLCVFVGVTHDDDPERAGRLAEKIFGLRVLDDADGVMNRSLADAAGDRGTASASNTDVAGAVLVVSQFTLYGDTRKGRRPSWSAAAPPAVAEPLVERVVERLRELGGAQGLAVATGRFRTEMRVELVNDGPVTLLLEV